MVFRGEKILQRLLRGYYYIAIGCGNKQGVMRNGGSQGFQGFVVCFFPSLYKTYKIRVILNLIQNLPFGPLVVNNCNGLTTQSVDPEPSSG